MFARKTTPEAKEFIQQNKDMSTKELTALVNEKFGINVSYSTVGYLAGKWKRHCKYKKPSFLYKPIDTERIDKDGYIRVITPTGEKLKHHIVWEQSHEPIKRTEVLMFVDGDKTNCNIDNLVLVKRKYTGALNSICGNLGLIKPEARKTAILSAILTVETKEQELSACRDKTKFQPKKDIWRNIVNLYKQGETKINIAKILNCHISCVYWVLKRYELGYYERYL